MMRLTSFLFLFFILGSVVDARAETKVLEQKKPRVILSQSHSKNASPSKQSYSSNQVAALNQKAQSTGWKTYITCTIFWVGEQPTQNNPTPNCKSSWDTKWMENFGGYDDPNPANRIANQATGEFRPKNFIPKQNSFYVALPYNDVVSYNTHKPEAARVIPWFSKYNPSPGQTVCKGRWIQIYNGRYSCYAQWEDCGPWETTDWEYVFCKKPPQTIKNGKAGLDVSPSVRDYLGLKSGGKVHWRFVEDWQVPQGPWKKVSNPTPTSRHLALTLQRQRLSQFIQVNPKITAKETENKKLAQVK